jgi:hypothetical protein
MKDKPTEKYLTTREICREYKITGDAITTWLRAGQLPADQRPSYWLVGIKVGDFWRIPVEEWEAFLRRCNEPQWPAPAPSTAAAPTAAPRTPRVIARLARGKSDRQVEDDVRRRLGMAPRV